MILDSLELMDTHCQQEKGHLEEEVVLTIQNPLFHIVLLLQAVRYLKFSSFSDWLEYFTNL